MRRSILALVALMLGALPLIGASGGGLSKAEEHHWKGTEHLDESRFDEAIAEFTKAIELNPNLAEAYAGRALAYTALGNHQEAEQDIEEAMVGIDPDRLREFVEGLKSHR